MPKAVKRGATAGLHQDRARKSRTKTHVTVVTKQCTLSYAASSYSCTTSFQTPRFGSP